MAPPPPQRPAREPLVARSAGDQDHGEHGGSEDDRGFVKAELRVMWMIGWPMAISFFCRFAMMTMDAAFVGHIKDDEGAPLLARLVASVATGTPGTYETKDYLAGASLSDMVTSIMTIPLLAMAFGISPLVGQALGAGGSKMAGTWVQLSVFCITVASVPQLIAFFFVGDILQALGFHPKLCELAGTYAKWCVIWLIPNSWYVALRFYFQAQGLARPAMYIGLLFVGVNAVMNYILVFGGPFEQWVGWPGIGFIGAALSISISRNLQCLLYVIYMFVWRRAHLPTWPGWNTDFLRVEHVRAFLAQTLPQVGTMLLQMLIGQSITLLVAKLGTLPVAASSAAQSATIPFTITFLATLSTLAAIRVGFHLGAGRADLARRTAWMVINMGIAMMIAFAVVIMLLRFEMMALMTSDEEVRDLSVQILPAVMVNMLANSVVQCGTGGVLASQGRTRLSTVLSLCFELPLSLGTITVLVLAFHADVRVVYWTQAAASVVEAAVVLLIVRSSDWERYAVEARARQSRHRPPPAAGDAGDSENSGPRPAEPDCAELQATPAESPSAAGNGDLKKPLAVLAEQDNKEATRIAGA